MAQADRSKSPARGSLLEAALNYAAQDTRVFPLHGIGSEGFCTCGKAACDNPGKHPRTRNGLKAATTDEVRIRSWWKCHPDSNVGAVPGPPFLVLDVDPRNGGFASLEDMERANGPLPATAVVETGEYVIGGDKVRGVHIWLRVPDGKAVPRRKELARGVELKADRGYVVMPPSRHASGVEYRWRD